MTTMRVVGECFFWYRLTRVFPDKFHRGVKRLCVCVCVSSDFVDRHAQLKTNTQLQQKEVLAVCISIFFHYFIKSDSYYDV